MHPIELIKQSVERELAVICKCSVDELPASLSPMQSAAFFGIDNLKTLHVWKSTGRHSLIWLKRGRTAEISTDSAIQNRIDSAYIPAGEAA